MQAGAIRDYVNGKTVKDIDVLVYADPKASTRDRFAINSTNTIYVPSLNCEIGEAGTQEPFSYFSHAFQALAIPGIKTAELLGDAHYPVTANQFAVIRIELDNDEINNDLFHAGVSQKIDVILTSTQDYAAFVDEAFNFGVCKIIYDRFGLCKTNHYMFDFDAKTISVDESKFTKEELFKMLVRDHLSRIKAKYPEHRPLLITRNFIDDYRTYTSIAVDPNGLIMTTSSS